MFSGRLLWITGGIGAAAIICCIALGIALRNQSKTIDRLEADIQAYASVREADASSQSVKTQKDQEAQSNAQAKTDILNGISCDTSDDAALAGLRRVFVESANKNTDSAGKSACRLPDAGSPGGSVHGH